MITIRHMAKHVSYKAHPHRILQGLRDEGLAGAWSKKHRGHSKAKLLSREVPEFAALLETQKVKFLCHPKAFQSCQDLRLAMGGLPRSLSSQPEVWAGTKRSGDTELEVFYTSDLRRASKHF